ERIIAAFGGASYLAINMGGKAPAKDWGREKWRALIQSLAGSYGDYGLLVVGAKEDSRRAAELRSCWPGQYIDACNHLSPRESAAAMKRARAFIGHDSGPLHLAAAVGVSCIGIFGNTDKPKKWHPYFGQHRIIHQIQGVRHISVSDVYEAVRKIL